MTTTTKPVPVVTSTEPELLTKRPAANLPVPENDAPATTKFSACWRILAWLVLTTAVCLGAMIVTVSSVLEASHARDMNSDVVQELEEFKQFAREGYNPETAQPFEAVEPLIDVYLRRQRAGAGEIMLGSVDKANVVQQLRGPQTPNETIFDADALAAFKAEFAKSTSGITQTPAGELRWGRIDVKTSTGESGSLVVGIFAEVGQRQIAQTTQVMLYVAIGALLVPALIGWLVAGHILRPIRVMRQTAAEITQEDLSRRIPVHGRDDLAELAVTFNSMLDRLETAFATEQRFIDDASHELRTPITVIRGHLELLSDEPVERDATLAIVHQELDRMGRIVSDLLALAKSERPDFVQCDRAVDIADLTLDIDAKVQALAPRNWVLTHVAEGPAIVDGQRVTQAMLQLAQNAVQHTRAGDEIRLASTFALSPEGVPVVQLTVKDFGPGVAAADAEVIFGRFARGTARRESGQKSGAGLGLAIVRAIADGHGGSAFVASTPGEGATFGLELPTRMPLGAGTADDTEAATTHLQEVD